MREFTIGSNDAGLRLDRFLAKWASICCENSKAWLWPIFR